MLCDICLAPRPGASSSSSSSSPAPLIASSDRDEHIRISRWGKQRQGHVVENFLLGSDSFVAQVRVVRHPNPSEGKQWALVSSDGGNKLRLWDYLELDQSKQCIGEIDVAEAMRPYVREEVLRLRKEAKKDDTLAIVQLEVTRDASVFRAEGSQALFLASTSSPHELKSIHFTRPITHFSVVDDKEVVVALDVRYEPKALSSEASREEGDVLSVTLGALSSSAKQLQPLQASHRPVPPGEHARASLTRTFRSLHYLFCSSQHQRRTSSRSSCTRCCRC